MAKHPMQRIRDGRFVANKIVTYLLDHGGIDMNELAIVEFPREDREQFAQLIGYSVSGWGELSYVSDESYAQAEILAVGGDSNAARVQALESVLESVRKPLREAACAAFSVHPDDLQSSPS